MIAGVSRIVIAVGLLVGLAHAAEPLTVNFAGAAVGALPAGFTAAMTGRGSRAKWVVVEDRGAAGGRALAETGNDPTDYRFPLAIHDTAAKNVEVTIRFRAVEGRVDQAAGIALRLADPDNYYVVRANALEDNVNFYRVVKGNRQQISGARARVARNVWHTLTLRAEGDRFTVSLDDRQLFAATDRTFSNAGKVALWTKADSLTHFDSLTVTALP